MKKTIRRQILIICLWCSASLAYAGNIAEVKLNRLSLGMKQEQIISVLGQPDLVRAEGLNAERKTVERMEYSVTKRIDPSKQENDSGELLSTFTCSLTLVDGILVRIGRRSEKPETPEKTKDDSNDYGFMMKGVH
jgi:hypothetical protein